MTVWSFATAMGAGDVGALLDKVETGCASRSDFTPAMTREQAEGAISAILWAYGCRSSDTAAAYAFMALWESLNIDIMQSKIVRLKDRQP